MTLIASRYHLLKKLASGGMAEVWLAEQRGPGSFLRRVVVKTIHKHLIEDSNLVTAFADEARLAALLHHPYIVRVEDYGEHDERPFLVMEYLEGHNLKQLASLANGQDAILPERLIVQLGIQVAEALRYAHQLKSDQGQPLQVVHRDVSPQNIMLSPSGSAKLVDFGIARAASNEGETRTGTLKGKLAYLSPEQASGKKGIDHRSDQFSLGVVLWELLIGSRLFASDSDVGTLKRVAFGDIPSLALYGQNFSQSLIQTIDRSLSRERSDRFNDCSEFAQALRVCLSELGGSFTDSDYRAWLAQIAGHLSVPKPLPLLSEEAVQRTESVPAIEAHNPAMEAMLKAHEVQDQAPDETVLMPSFRSGSNLSEEATQISSTLAQMEVDQPTRVSLRVVGTQTRPSLSPSDAQDEVGHQPTPNQSKILLWLLISALVGVAFVIMLGTHEDSVERSESPAVLPAGLTHKLERKDQLSRADFLEVIDGNRALLNGCLMRFGTPDIEPLIEMSIRSSGKPTSVQVGSARPKLSRCLKRALKSLKFKPCLLYTSPSPRDRTRSRMPSSA